jgi:hypothetical protein
MYGPLLKLRKPVLTAAAVLICTSLLGGCAPGAPPKQAHDVRPRAANVHADTLSCQLAGGEMKPVGRRQLLQCVLSYADAGKSCSSGSQCEGDCRVGPGVEAVPGQDVVGQCQATSDRFGCSTRVEEGRAEATICID